MSGKFSRSKGRRGEYAARDLLRTLGYECDRVPLSGASQGYKGDLRFSKDGKEYLAEVKVRKPGAFKHIYALWSEGALKQTTFASESVIAIYAEDRAICVAPTPQAALRGGDWYAPVIASNSKGFKQLLKIEEFVKGCDMLIIKEDHKPFLFITYR